MNNFKKLHRIHQAAWLGIGIIALLAIASIILFILFSHLIWLPYVIGVCYLGIGIWQIIIGVQEKHTLSLVAGILGILFWPAALVLDIIIVLSKK